MKNVPLIRLGARWRLDARRPMPQMPPMTPQANEAQQAR